MQRQRWRQHWATVASRDDHAARLLQPEGMTRDYLSVNAYQRDAAMLARQGWQVASVVDHRTTGLANLAARWWHTFRGHHVPELVVTYRRLH